MDEKPFVLRNDPPRPRKLKVENGFNNTQGVLFTGTDLLPGQQDLFDGVEPVKKPERAVDGA